MPYQLDKKTILDRLGGDEEIMTMMLDMVVQEVPGYCAALDAALVSGQMAVLQRGAHTAKGTLATVADEAGAALAYEIEQAAKENRGDGLPAAVAALKARLVAVAEVLSASPR